MDDNEIGKILVECAINVHKALGPGLLESCYEACLAYELKKRGLKVERQKQMPVKYDNILIDVGYRLDLLVENQVVAELKSVNCLLDIHTAQTLTYMRLGGFKLGYLMNFNVNLMKDGIKRLILY